MRDETYMTLVRLLPRAAYSSAVGMFTRARAPPSVHRLAMRAFARRFNVAMDEAEHGFEGYDTFAQFFTRKLKPGLRPIDPDPRAVVSPVDGAVSQAGYAEKGECVQAKGICYPVAKLLGDEAEARRFEGGAFATLYLSPRDYHRIHAPLDGQVTGYSYIPGEFWPVNPASVRSVDALFCVNERLTTYFDTAAGRVALVAVGATAVSRIKASYDEVVTHQNRPGLVHRYDAPRPLKKGDEVAMFEMGSTVILLFEKGRVRWDPSLTSESEVRLGRRIGVVA
jgi:phosphatidylserine decarboxylase